MHNSSHMQKTVMIKRIEIYLKFKSFQQCGRSLLELFIV